MQLLLEEEKNIFILLESQLKEQIEICKKFEHEADNPIKEKQLQSTLEKYQFHLKERKHKQYLRHSTDFKEQRAYSFLPSQGQKEPETEISSTEVSDSDRELSNRGSRQNFRNRVVRGHSKNRGQGRGNFLDPKHPYQLRDRIFPPLNQS